MTVDDRVRHKSGSIGIIKRIRKDYVFVVWEGWNIALPYRAEWLTVIEEEGEHGHQEVTKNNG
ncbi:hypothetical protein D3C81_173840 [compost metagenome]